MIGWFYALFCLKWKAHQSVVGVGINLFASGITAVMLKAIWQTEGMSESVPSISNLTIPGLSGIPVIGALFKDQSPYLYAMFLIVAAVWIVFYKTKFGLRYLSLIHIFRPATSFSHITNDPIIKKHLSMLGEAVDQVGGPQARNTATIGGNICNGATSADSASTMCALNATVVLKGPEGVREVPVTEFYTGPGRCV